jgi:hypothetical protein
MILEDCRHADVIPRICDILHQDALAMSLISHLMMEGRHHSSSESTKPPNPSPGGSAKVGSLFEEY